MQRRESKYYEDIDNIPCIPIVPSIIVLVVGVLVFLLYYAAQPNAKDVKSYNEQVAKFNTLPKLEREVFAPFCEKTLDNSLRLESQKMPISIARMLEIAFPWWLLVELIVCSISTFIIYWCRKSVYYQLADLPFDTIYGWRLFITMLPVGWPFLLGSRIIMWHKNRPMKQAEKAEVERIAREELTLDDSLQKPVFTERARHAYIEIRTQHYQDSRLHAIRQLHKKIANLNFDVDCHSQHITELQRIISADQAELKQLESRIPNRNAAKDEAQSEWQQILNMRGVTKITTSKRKIIGLKRKQRLLRILIKARVSYCEKLYDFGDYEITFFEDSFACHKVRSGVRLNHTSDLEKDFCFKPHLKEIEEYVQNGRILEALTLIVDCLHSVKPGHEKYIPGCYRRVKTVEKAKRRLALRQTFQKKQK